LAIGSAAALLPAVAAACLDHMCTRACEGLRGTTAQVVHL
jgi:hypothetical protein